MEERSGSVLNHTPDRYTLSMQGAKEEDRSAALLWHPDHSISHSVRGSPAGLIRRVLCDCNAVNAGYSALRICPDPYRDKIGGKRRIGSGFRRSL